ncbi:DUF4421 domain-containing protein [Pseudoprevotella muciniphila]|uniref:DUF4421 domain-containing protein n=1 Tax=Pseudoprevotella muciniphila TaxID=2133944 RepID=A0A5P8E608_9BACT|nr:DUF4421 family protein [Pseudoprevotella muciniphila]QFQ12443.1 DUF4421 domain-containing protein [Pseudoprevotella muciniphila]
MKRIITLILVLTVFSLTISAQKKIPYLLKKIAAHYDSAAVKNIDRNYIEVPSKPWQIMLKGNANQSSLKMKAQGELLGIPFSAKPQLKTEPAQYVGVWVGYRGHGMGYTVNVAGDKGSYFTLNSKGKSYGLNLRIHSFTNDHPRFGIQSTLIPEDNLDEWENIQLKDPIRVHTFIADGYYLFNSRRFSYASAYNYSVVQKRSAGSLMIGAMAYYGHINYATHSNADLIYLMNGLGRVKLYQGSLGVGYAYNWAPTQRLLVNVMVMPALTLVNKMKAYGYDTNILELTDDPRFMDETISNEEWDAWWDSSKRIAPMIKKSFNSGLAFNFNSRLSISYNLGRYFIGAYGQFDTFRYKHKDSKGRLRDWYLNAAFGIRL